MQVRKPPTGRKICPVTKSNTSNSVLSPTYSQLTAPNDKEQKAPMMVVATVTIVAPVLRDRCSSSLKNDVLTSCKEIREVNAARLSRE